MTAHTRIDADTDFIPQEWFDLNYRLQKEAVDININKTFLNLWIIRLKAMISPDSKCFGLFMARINELALYCAAHYTDCGELNAAGELLFGKCDFFSKCEGRSLQLYSTADRECCEPSYHDPADSVDHIHSLRDVVEICEEPRPLIPFLSGLLVDLGYLSGEYIASVHRRIEKIQEVIGTFAEQGIDSCEALSQRLSSMDDDRKRRFLSMGCLFDRVIFDDLGRELHIFMHCGEKRSKYLRESCHPVCISYGFQLNATNPRLRRPA